MCEEKTHIYTRTWKEYTNSIQNSPDQDCFLFSDTVTAWPWMVLHKSIN